MKKQSILLLLCGAVLLGGCGSKDTQQETSQEKKSVYSQEYQITGNYIQNSTLNGVVVSENIINLLSQKGGTIKTINCQPGKYVKAGTTIATISPDTNDPNYQNMLIQRDSIQNQFNNIMNTISSTSANFDLEIAQLNTQKQNNDQQIAIIKENIANQKKQKALSSGDISSQLDNLEQQIDYLEQQKDKLNQNIKNLEDSKKLLNDNKAKDIDKLNKNLESLKKQINISVSSSLNSVNNVFYFSTDKKGQSPYDDFLSAKNTSLRSEIEGQYNELVKTTDTVLNMSNDQLPAYLDRIGAYLEKVARSVNSSVSSTNLSQTQIDTYYNTFNGLSNTMYGYKTSLDNIISSIKTTENTYQNQIVTNIDVGKVSYENQIKSLDSSIDSLKKNLANIKNNKSGSSDLGYDISINSLESTLANLNSTNENFQKQIDGLRESKRININQLENQKINLNQNLDTIKTNISGERILAPRSGTIKKQGASEGNKVSVNTTVCQITPEGKTTLKLQIFSPSDLEIGKVFNFSKDGNLIGTGEVEFKVPYKDDETQNFIFESRPELSKLSEGDKINIKFEGNQKTSDIIIPIQYILPKLDGSYVSVKSGDQVFERKIDLGNMDGGYIKVLSGLNSGEILVR